VVGAEGIVLNLFNIAIPLILFGSLSMIPTVILLVVAWRIMQAQERMAQAMADIASQRNH
jgi:hypothetical protein